VRASKCFLILDLWFLTPAHPGAILCPGYAEALGT